MKLTIITNTIRRGFWNIMANNLASQTLHDFEWVIVDDFPEDRSRIAGQYSERYGLDVVYLRAKKRKVQRRYGLVNANNTSFPKARGDILVYVQDFTLLPRTALERYYILHEENPSALIAGCDSYFYPKSEPKIESEDWFSGETDVVGTFIRSSWRITSGTTRDSRNPFEFEMNYGAIPRNIVNHLNGWWEFMDDGLGFDNTEIAFRAILAGYSLLVDETNVATCLDHWKPLRGTRENVWRREFNLNDPRYLFLVEMTRRGKLPLVRNQEIDDRISIDYCMPENVTSQQQAVDWINANNRRLALEWTERYSGVLS